MDTKSSEISSRYNPNRRAAQSRVVELEGYLSDLVAASRALVYAIDHEKFPFNRLVYQTIFEPELKALKAVLERLPDGIREPSTFEKE